MSVQAEVLSPTIEVFLNEAATKTPEIFAKFKQEGSLLVMEVMRETVPVRSGFLRESITRSFSADGFAVYPTARYAEFVEKGTGPHTILPVRAKALRFENVWGGVVFAKRVEHPGFAGRFFAARTLDAIRYNLVELFKDIMEATLG